MSHMLEQSKLPVQKEILDKKNDIMTYPVRDVQYTISWMKKENIGGEDVDVINIYKTYFNKLLFL